MDNHDQGRPDTALRTGRLRPRTIEKGLGEISSEVAQDRPTWSASVRDLAKSIGDAASTRPGRMLTQIQVNVKGVLLQYSD